MGDGRWEKFNCQLSTVRGCLRSLIARFLVARSPLTPLEKGGTGLLVPLFKGDLGGSSRA